MKSLVRTTDKSGIELTENFILVEIIQKDRKQIILSKDSKNEPVLIERLEVKGIGPDVKLNINIGDSVKINSFVLNAKDKFVMEFGREYLLLSEFDIYGIVREMEYDESFKDLTEERYSLPKNPAKTAANSSYLDEIKRNQWTKD